MVERCREEGECIEGAEILKLFFLFFFGAEVDNRKRPPNKGRLATSAGDLTEG